jgi:hypothetical protein
MKTLFYKPGDWLAGKFSARTRRSVAAWIIILTIVPGMPLTYIWKDDVWMVWLLSMIALVVGAWGIAAAETPVESEGG